MRIKDRDVIAFVTNGGFLDSNTADGLGQTLAGEFSQIYVYNLRGNQRTAGEQSRCEGGKVFDAGSRATVAITILVKNPATQSPATLHYKDIGDYLSRQDKLRIKTVQQLALNFDVSQWRDAIYARIVAKCGDRRYWETWASDIADIATAHITRITSLLADPSSVAAQRFEEFLGGLRGNLNDGISTRSPTPARRP